VTLELEELAVLVSEVIGAEVTDPKERLNLDSLHIVELVSVLEELCGVEIGEFGEADFACLLDLYRLYCTLNSMPRDRRPDVE
jgi:hypothetical protein